MTCPILPKPIHLSWHIVCIFSLLICLVIGHCTATRPARSMMTVEEISSSKVAQEISVKHYYYRRRNDHQQGLVLNLLPKGVPIPPSGPSKRHN